MPSHARIYELHVPAPTPSNNAIKGMHFHAYKILRNGRRVRVLVAIGGKVPAVSIAENALGVERTAPATWTGTTRMAG